MSSTRSVSRQLILVRMTKALIRCNTLLCEYLNIQPTEIDIILKWAQETGLYQAGDDRRFPNACQQVLLGGLCEHTHPELLQPPSAQSG